MDNSIGNLAGKIVVFNYPYDERSYVVAVNRHCGTQSHREIWGHWFDSTMFIGGDDGMWFLKNCENLQVLEF